MGGYAPRTFHSVNCSNFIEDESTGPQGPIARNGRKPKAGRLHSVRLLAGLLRLPTLVGPTCPAQTQREHEVSSLHMCGALVFLLPPPRTTTNTCCEQACIWTRPSPLAHGCLSVVPIPAPITEDLHRTKHYVHTRCLLRFRRASGT